MTESTGPAPSAALAAWLASPAEAQRLAGLVAAAVTAPIPASTIERLPAEGLAALQRGTGVRFTALRPSVRTAILIAGLGPALALTLTGEEQRDLEQIPFTLHVSGRELVIEISASLERRNGISRPFYHLWAAGVSAENMVIDCHRIEHVNSVLIAWILQIVQSSKPVPVQVRRARLQVATQLRQLRLDHLMKIE